MVPATVNATGALPPSVRQLKQCWPALWLVWAEAPLLELLDEEELLELDESDEPLAPPPQAVSVAIQKLIRARDLNMGYLRISWPS